MCIPLHSGSSVHSGRAGSSPASRTKTNGHPVRGGRFCFTRWMGLERERCHKTCRWHVFPATRPAPQGRSSPASRTKTNGHPVRGGRFVLLDGWDLNGSGVRKRAGGTFSPRPGLPRRAGQVPPCASRQNKAARSCGGTSTTTSTGDLVFPFPSQTHSVGLCDGTGSSWNKGQRYYRKEYPFCSCWRLAGDSKKHTACPCKMVTYPL